MASFKKRLKAVIKLIRPPYWLMTGGLSVLTILTLRRGTLEPSDPLTLALVALSAICISSGGFAFNDYVDQESDAIVKKNRPIPSKELAPWHALLAASILFTVGLAASVSINWVCFGIALADTVLLVAYSKVIKKRAGVLGSFLMGFLIGTSFVYGEAALTETFTFTLLSFPFMKSLSLSFIGGWRLPTATIALGASSGNCESAWCSVFPAPSSLLPDWSLGGGWYKMQRLWS